MAPMNVLALDCSTPHGSVALLSDGKILFHEEFLAERSHTASLFSCLHRARPLVSQFHRVAVGLGPGSYAGTRVAISAALGFQLGLGSELVGIPSVACLKTGRDEYLALGDARREEFSYSHVRAGICVVGPRIASEKELRGLLAAHPGLPLFCPTPVAGFDEAVAAPPCSLLLALRAATQTGIVQRDVLEPLYLREPYITQPASKKS